MTIKELEKTIKKLEIDNTYIVAVDKRAGLSAEKLAMVHIPDREVYFVLVDDVNAVKWDELNNFIKDSCVDIGKISDGYHTFDELYEHRIALFIALCNRLYEVRIASEPEQNTLPWKSKLHSDGTMFEGGWFIAGIGKEKGEQITYHLPIKFWDKLRVVAYDKAPEWDGHTPADVVERLLKL